MTQGERERDFTPSEALVDHVRRPRNVGSIHQPDGLGSATNECGDTIEISLRVRGGQIDEVAHLTRGCAWTMACASMATTLARGRSLVEARREVRPGAVAESLGGLPAGEEHCAELAASALTAAVDDAFATAREPWRRVYRTS